MATQAAVHNRVIRQLQAASVSQSKQDCDTRIGLSARSRLPEVHKEFPHRQIKHTRRDRVEEKKWQQFVFCCAQQTAVTRI